MKTNLTFSQFMYTTLCFGFLTTELAYKGSIPLLIALLILAVSLQRYLFGNKYLALDRIINRAENQDEKIYYRGNLYDPETKELREKRFLFMSYNLKKQGALRLASAAIAVIYGFFVMKNSHVGLTSTAFIQLICILTLIPVVSQNHKLIPLGFSAFAVCFGLIKSDQGPSFLHIIYLFLFFATLTKFSQGRETRVSKDLNLAGVGTLIFIFLFTLFNFLIPTFHPEKLKISARSRTLDSTAFQNTSSTDSTRKWPQRVGQGSGDSAEAGVGNEPGKGAGSAQGNGSGTGFGSGTGTSAGSGTKQGSPAASSNAESPKDSTDTENQKVGEAKNGKESQAAKTSSSAPMRSGQSSKNDQLPRQKIDKLEEAGKNLPKEEKTATSAGTSGGSKASQTVNKAEPPKQKKETLSPEKIENLIKWLARVLIALAFLFLLNHVLGLVSKKKNKDTPKLSRLQKESLMRELKSIESVTLSVRERIIKRYNLFLKVMDATKNTKESYLPPLDYSREMQSKFPACGPNFSVLTNTFSDAFYGNKTIGQEDYLTYEKSLKTVFKYFLR